MEQLDISRGVHNLTEQEKKNVHLAVCAGCLETIHDHIDEPNHSRRKRVLRQVRSMILSDLAPLLPPISVQNMEMFKETIRVSEKVMQEILEEHKNSRIHIMLNLAGFCLHELPARDKHWRAYNGLFDMWSEADQYIDVRSGDRIFNRIESELQIQVAQRGGVIL